MLTVRIHLDAMDADNGPVLVQRGSHRFGKSTVGDGSEVSQVTEIRCLAGTTMLMRPLLSHSSIASKLGVNEIAVPYILNFHRFASWQLDINGTVSSKSYEILSRPGRSRFPKLAA
ncbi:MAG: hypothetical protein ABL921_09235, partial [Pirellula sp.]